MAGKGDKWRKGTNYAKYREGWDLIKRKKKKELGAPRVRII